MTYLLFHEYAADGLSQVIVYYKGPVIVQFNYDVNFIDQVAHGFHAAYYLEDLDVFHGIKSADIF